MAPALEVARYLIQLAAQEEEPEALTHPRLQRLLYFMQGWSLALNGNPMFSAAIEAWKQGPVVQDVYLAFAAYNGQPIPPHNHAQPAVLTGEQQGFIRSVWESYKAHSAIRLRQMMQQEAPWAVARASQLSNEDGHVEISQQGMLAAFRKQYESRLIPGFELNALERANKDFHNGRDVPLEDLLKALAE